MFYCVQHDNTYSTYCKYCGVNIVQAYNETVKCVDCGTVTNQWVEMPAYSVCTKCWIDTDDDPYLSDDEDDDDE